jgi:hypothetical protein
VLGTEPREQIVPSTPHDLGNKPVGDTRIIEPFDVVQSLDQR